MFKPGTVTNQNELASLLRQALAGRQGRAVTEGTKRAVDLTLRGQRIRVVVGAGSGGQGTRLVSVFPTNTRSGLSLTRAEIEHLAAQVQSGRVTLDEVRAGLAARVGR